MTILEPEKIIIKDSQPTGVEGKKVEEVKEEIDITPSNIDNSEV